MTTYYVRTGGSDSYDGLSDTYTSGTNGPKASVSNAITTAIAASGSGHTINIGSGTFTGSANIHITETMTITGAGSTNTTISITGTVTRFTIDAGISVSFNGMKITGGNSSTTGGAIYNSGNLILNYVNFDGNAAVGNGGAIWTNGPVTATSCTFQNNTAENGASISSNNGKITLTSCTFTNNTASKKAGAVNLMYEDMDVTGCTFTGNVANNGSDHVRPPEGGLDAGNPAGGCFYIQGNATSDRCYITLTTSTFTSNIATYGCGGMAYTTKADIAIDDCDFIDNSVGGEFGNGYGGVFHNYQTNMRLTNGCTFDGNTATVGGGALCLDNGSQTIMSGGSFTDNITTGDVYPSYGNGGAVYCLDTATVKTGYTRFYNVTFSGNQATPPTGTAHHYGGGAIRILDTTCELHTCTLYNNSASSGGAVYKQSGTLVVDNTNAYSNTPDSYYPALPGDSGGIYTDPVTSGEDSSYMCIGPVELDDAHLADGSSFEFSNSASTTVYNGGRSFQHGQFSEEYSFSIVCTTDKALQLKGVVEQGEVIWMNTSDITDNDYMQHKGWVILTQLSISEENMIYCTCDISYIKVSDYYNEYLTMDYSRGIYDGVNIEPSYDITNSTTLMTESGTSTTNWGSTRHGYEKGGNGSGTLATDGTELDLPVTASVAGTYNYAWNIYSPKTFAPPFIINWTMDYNSIATSTTMKSMGIGLTSNTYPDGSKLFDSKRTDFFEVYFDVSNITKLGARTKKGSTYTTLVAPTTFSNTSTKSVRFSAEFTADGKVKILADTTDSGTPTTQIYYGSSGLTSYSNGLKLYLWVANKNTSAWTGSFRNFTVTRESDAVFPNIVAMPPSSYLVDTDVTGSRTVEDGTMYYYANPSTELRYNISGPRYYYGSVKLMSDNNDDESFRQVFSTGTKLSVDSSTTLSNGMTKLVFDSTGFTIQAWHDSQWNNINKITYTGGITYLKPIFINSERVVLQVNATKITMLRSNPMFNIEHPVTDLGYTLKDSYTTGSGTTSSPLAGAPIAMLADNQYYMAIYNSTDTYRLLAVKKDPCNINSDSFPADEITGLGWYSSSGTNYETVTKVSQSWYRQTRTGISLKQIV